MSPIAIYGFFKPSLFNLINKSKLSFISSFLKHVTTVSAISPGWLTLSEISTTTPTIVNSLFSVLMIFSPSCRFSAFFSFILSLEYLSPISNVNLSPIEYFVFIMLFKWLVITISFAFSGNLPFTGYIPNLFILSFSAATTDT